MAASAAEIYEEHVRSLSIEQRRQLLALIAENLAVEASPEPAHSLAELRGLGKEIWAGIDAQEYVNRLRDEWDERPT